MEKKFNDFQDVTYAAIYKDGYPMNERAVAESMDRNFGGNNLQDFLDKKGIKDDSAIPKGYIDDVYDSFEGIEVKRQGWPMFKSHSIDLDEIKNRKHLVDNLEEIDFAPEIEKNKSVEDLKTKNFSEEELKAAKESFLSMFKSHSSDDESYKKEMRQTMKRLQEGAGTEKDLMVSKGFLSVFESVENKSIPDILNDNNPESIAYVGFLRDMIKDKVDPELLHREQNQNKFSTSTISGVYANLMGGSSNKTPPLWPDIETGFEAPENYQKEYQKLGGKPISEVLNEIDSLDEIDFSQGAGIMSDIKERKESIVNRKELGVNSESPLSTRPRRP